MSSPTGRAEGRRPTALHAVAVTTLFTFGCATVRAPVSGIGPTVPVHGSTAEPQVELWLESGAEPTPAESARAAEDAREALRQALQDRTLGEDDVLVVRAQAVSRTRSRRADQHAAIAGIVVGAIVLIALAVVVSRGKGGGGGRVSGGRVARGGGGGGFRPGTVPRPTGGFHPGVVPVRAFPGPGMPSHPVAPGRPGGVSVSVDVSVVTPDQDGGTPVEVLAGETSPPGQDASPPPPPATERISAVTLPAPSPLSLQDRGFFAGDWLRLELLVVDARTGAVRWAKTVADDVDVRDAPGVRRAIDAALATEAGWYVPSADDR